MLVLVWRWLSKTPWREIGYVRPWSWTLEALIGAVSGVAFKFAMKAVVMPLLGAEPVNHTFHYLAHNQAEVLPFAFYAVILGAGFGEETVFRGWLFERLGQDLRTKRGRQGADRPCDVGPVRRRPLFDAGNCRRGAGPSSSALRSAPSWRSPAASGPLMWAHAAFDLAALAMIYYDCETSIAHLVFK